jgi:ORF6N domain
MLDGSLAFLYGVETRALIQAVKRNLARFPADFMFQLTAEEAQRSRSQSVILNAELAQDAPKRRGGGKNIKSRLVPVLLRLRARADGRC